MPVIQTTILGPNETPVRPSDLQGISPSFLLLLLLSTPFVSFRFTFMLTYGVPTLF